ncbi:MAG: 5-oxoprolinase subunit PxpA [Opitutae bacterium]|nr:5-oxoprolinase subunit PxpA [Opitutae bacterium]
MRTIDLNCDLGEGAGRDAELMPLITSANIACGAHAGDEATMRATVTLAKKHGVAIGAHPGFADRENFGRIEKVTSQDEVYQLVLTQAQALRRLAQEAGAKVTHVKPHGALYNMAARNALLADAVAQAAYDCDPRLVLFGLAGSALVRAAERCGLAVAQEVFADRTYHADGTLTLRGRPDAIITAEPAAVAQVLRMVREGKVRAVDGADVAIHADTICLHGDGPHPVEFARRLRRELLTAGIEVKAHGA